MEKRICEIYRGCKSPIRFGEEGGTEQPKEGERNGAVDANLEAGMKGTACGAAVPPHRRRRVSEWNPTL